MKTCSKKWRLQTIQGLFFCKLNLVLCLDASPLTLRWISLFRRCYITLHGTVCNGPKIKRYHVKINNRWSVHVELSILHLQTYGCFMVNRQSVQHTCLLWTWVFGIIPWTTWPTLFTTHVLTSSHPNNYQSEGKHLIYPPKWVFGWFKVLSAVEQCCSKSVV